MHGMKDIAARLITAIVATIVIDIVAIIVTAILSFRFGTVSTGSQSRCEASNVPETPQNT